VLNLANHWIECPEKGDVSDWLAAGHTREELLSLIASAPDWTPPVDDAPKIIISSAEFVAGFTPPEYLIDRILQRRYIYSFTGKTGDGKTAVALSFAASIALGLRIGGHEVERNRVLYFAGENSTDVRQRWIAMAEQMKFNANTIDVHFVDGAFKLSKIADRVKQELEVLGEVALVIVDTAAAYFEGTEENDNVQMGNYARSLRSLIGLTGGPTVLVLCHPVKNATSDNLIPRGGGAFLAEMDGNLTCLKSDPLCTVHWQAKFRGCDFEPMTFRLQTTTATKLVDAKGRKVTTVVARPISEDEQKVAAASSRQDEDDVLIVMTENDGLSIAGIAKKLNWLSKNGEPQKSKVHRIVNRLREDELVREERGTAILTDKGEMAAETARSKRAAGRATTG
jgi:hypothetical protein